MSVIRSPAERLDRRAEMLLVVSPSSDRVLIERLVDLVVGGRSDVSLRLVETETFVRWWEVEEVENASGGLELRLRECFVVE